MNIHIDNEADLAFEIIFFLKLYLDEKARKEWLKTIHEDRNIIGREEANLILDLYNELSQTMDTDYQNIELLFETLIMDADPFSNLAMMMLTIESAYAHNPTVAKKDLFIMKLLDKDEKSKMQLNECIQELEKSKYSSQAKWNIMKVYVQYEYYNEQLFQVIASLQPMFKKVYKKANFLFVAFDQYWGPIIAENNFVKIFKELTTVDLDMKNMSIYPSILAFYSVAINIYNMHIGVTFHKTKGILHNFSEDKVIEILKIMSDPSKFEILKMIKDEALYGQQIAKAMDLSTATISHHTSKLIDHGLLEVKAENNRVFYKANKQQIKRLLERLEEIFK